MIPGISRFFVIFILDVESRKFKNYSSRNFSHTTETSIIKFLLRHQFHKMMTEPLAEIQHRNICLQRRDKASLMR